MSNRFMPASMLRDCVTAVAEHDGNISNAAKQLGIPRSTLQSRLRAAEMRNIAADSPIPDSALEFPDFPVDDMPVEDLIDHAEKRFLIRAKSHAAHTWYKVKVNDTLPIGTMWFGDPHVDDNGCHWPTLTRHTRLCRDTKGLYGANIGDTTNNWSGRLAHLYANQDTSVKTARRYATWFMLEAGIHWLVWLVGNHDAWSGGDALLRELAKRYSTHELICHDWESRFILQFPNGHEFRIWAAHDFPGHSMWNPLHGPLRASQMSDQADLYVCGHKHNWGCFRYENADRGIIQTVIRVRGYKFLDDYARRMGVIEQQTGCSILTIFDPDRGEVTAFEDIEAGVDFLTWLRKKRA